MLDHVKYPPGTTMVHPETGAVLSRRRRIETLEYMGLSRTIEVEAFWPSTFHILTACVCGDSKPMRHGKIQDAHHLGEVGTLSTEKVFHVSWRTAMFVVEGIYKWPGGKV
jgi:hypothetical protein